MPEPKFNPLPTLDPLGPLFQPGRIVATPGALDRMHEHGVDPCELLRRHLTGDWGDVCREDAAANVSALEHGDRLLSSYVLADDAKIWIITERDRSATTFLRPEDY